MHGESLVLPHHCCYCRQVSKCTVPRISGHPFRCAAMVCYRARLALQIFRAFIELKGKIVEPRGMIGPSTCTINCQ